jgi:hypothetical protein
MRTDLQVPFAEKDEAKRLGARWDATRKVWYVQNESDLAPFSRWLPSADRPAAAAPARTAAATTLQKSDAGLVAVGSRYVKQARVCDCPPWQLCDSCRPMALPLKPASR